MVQSKIKNSVANERGQGLIEYLVIVALMGVATIAIVRVMGQTVSQRFATITSTLQGKTHNYNDAEITATTYKKHDLGDFFEGTADKNGAGKKGARQDADQ